MNYSVIKPSTKKQEKLKLTRNIFIILTLFTIIGFIIAYMTNYKPNMKIQTFRQELDLLLGDTCYHIHHWISFTIIIIIILISRYVANDYIIYSIIGLLLGFIFEGFLFTGKRSAFKIINSCKLKNKKYSS